MARSYWTFVVTLLFYCTLTSGAATTSDVPLLSSHDATVIPDHYIVILKDNIPNDDFNSHLTSLTSFIVEHSSNEENRLKHRYDFDELKGYAGKFHPDVVNYLRNHDSVAYIEKDQVVRTSTPIIFNRFPQSLNSPFEVTKNQDKKQTLIQAGAPWGLSRISHRTIPTGDEYKEYVYPKSAGENVTVYVIDTGININHVDFEGRASWGITVPENDEDVDGNGHGTHVAGTVAGKTYGVSKKSSLVAIKVLSSNGSGSMSDVIKGVEWAVSDHVRRKKKNKITRSVANMSLGGGRSRTLDNAVNAAVGAGVHFAVAAGNDNRDACNSSPAAAGDAVTVGATAIDDRMAWFSNHGKCVDVFAPGKDILSSWIGSKTATNTISGTSMASPHVAGLLALLQGIDLEKEYTGKELKALVISLSTKDAIKGLPKKGGSRKPPNWPFPWPPGGDDDDDGEESKTPNRLIFNGVNIKKDDPSQDEDNPKLSRSNWDMLDKYQYNDVVSSSKEETTPGFEGILDQFIQETLQKAEGIAGWMRAKVTSISMNIVVDRE